MLSANDIRGYSNHYYYVLFLLQQLNLIGERDEVPIHFCDKCGLPIQLYGRMVRTLLM